MRKRSDLFPKKYKRHQRLHNFSSWQEHLHPVYNMWWHFLPSLCLFGGIFRHHFSILMALSATMTFFSLIWVVALFAVTLLFWWHFLPPLLHFDGTFCLHTFSALICAGALSAPICTFWGRFLPPLAGFTYSVVSFTITSASNITFSAISAPSSDNSFVSGGISTSSCSLITESPTAAS